MILLNLSVLGHSVLLMNLVQSFLEIEQDKSDRKWREERSSDYDSSLGTLEKNTRAQVRCRQG